MSEMLVNLLAVVSGVILIACPILVLIANQRQHEWEVRFNHEQEQRKRKELEGAIVKRIKELTSDE